MTSARNWSSVGLAAQWQAFPFQPKPGRRPPYDIYLNEWRNRTGLPGRASLCGPVSVYHPRTGDRRSDVPFGMVLDWGSMGARLGTVDAARSCRESRRQGRVRSFDEFSGPGLDTAKGREVSSDLLDASAIGYPADFIPEGVALAASGSSLLQPRVSDHVSPID